MVFIGEAGQVLGEYSSILVHQHHCHPRIICGTIHGMNIIASQNLFDIYI